MNFNWLEFLALAEELQNRIDEASKRTAVSRAYYAIFCYTRNYAEKYLGFRAMKGPEDHSQLRKFFSSKGPTGRSIADKLRDLHKWRKQCDYDDFIDNLDFQVKSAILTAKKVIQELSKILTIH